jgi:ribosomal-protein-alanine acetyltransferase
MIELERACPTAAHWSQGQYQQAVGPRSDDPQRLVLVAEAGSRVPAGETPDSSPCIVGFLVARHLASEWELENIVVAPTACRKGFGGRLLETLLAKARETNSQTVFLEVRASNAPARNLYERTGFKETGCRKAYYADPVEDAILYRLDLGAPG